jgi:hypothetical protein
LDSAPVCQRLLRKVIAKVGGPFSAAKQLGLSPWSVHRVLDGAAPMPDDVFQRALDLVREKPQTGNSLQAPAATR